MRRKFNVTGSCNPERHYMVDTAKRFDSVKEMIDAGEYFAINRARQYGKTTMLQTIRRKLSDRYLIIKTSQRFGKSVAAKMLCAYYDHSCDSRGLFATPNNTSVVLRGQINNKRLECYPNLNP